MTLPWDGETAVTSGQEVNRKSAAAEEQKSDAAFLTNIPANVWNMESLDKDETQNSVFSGKLLKCNKSED